MKPMRAVMAAVVLAVIGAACTVQQSPDEKTGGKPAFEPYFDPPAVRTFPSSAAVVNGWVAAGDTVSVRAHGWDMWESITSIPDGGTTEPVWETWYSGHELFEIDTAAAARAVAAAQGDMRKLVIPRSSVRTRFELPRQTRHARRALLASSGMHAGIPVQDAGGVFSFNRYTRTTATQIFGRRLYDGRVLQAINDAFNRQGAPVAVRQILVSSDSTDAKSIVLKPVFQFIDGHNPSCIPYWAGDTPQVTDSAGKNPVASQWKQWVIVDPAGALKGQATAKSLGFANCPASGIAMKVVGLDKFHHHTLTQAMVDSFSVFADNSGDDVGRLDSTSAAAILAMIKPGNIGLLVAMHVTGKEIANWTWQSFWWSPTPNDSLGADRPRTIRAPWNNYQMTTAYWMTYPANAPSGSPRIAYNPYLETSLQGMVDTIGTDSVRWYGPTTNCMSCHRMASWKTSVGKAGTCWTGPKSPYVPASYLDAGNAALLAGLTKTDFLWSVAIRSTGIPACQ